MSRKYLCDACAATIPPEDVAHFGEVHVRDYCADCANDIRAYLSEIDRLHDRVAKDFRDGLRAIRTMHLEHVKALPDVPDDYLEDDDG